MACSTELEKTSGTHSSKEDIHDDTHSISAEDKHIKNNTDQIEHTGISSVSESGQLS